MQTLAVVPTQTRVIRSLDDRTIEYSFALTPHDQQTDIAYVERVGEVHLNVALGRLCTIGCKECSATQIGRSFPVSARGNLSPQAVGQKIRSIIPHLRPLLHERSLVISTMNDGDPLTRSADDLIKTVQQMHQACADMNVPLDRLNLSSSLVASKSKTVIELANRYSAVFGSHVVQLQASLLATTVKRNIFAGDGSQLEVIAQALAWYHSAMRSATQRGEVWVNYVAVKRGDFGRIDSANQLDTVARVADTLQRVAPVIKLKITRGTVDGLLGWQQLEDDEYERFVDAVIERWGGSLAIYCPDRSTLLARHHRCGRIQG